MSFIYDRYAELYADGKGWGTGIGFGGYDGNNRRMPITTLSLLRQSISAKGFCSDATRTREWRR